MKTIADCFISVEISKERLRKAHNAWKEYILSARNASFTLTGAKTEKNMGRLGRFTVRPKSAVAFLFEFCPSRL